MGKLAKPQRSKKHKKIKAIDPFYKGNRKDIRTKDLNKVPKSYEQEVPKKLKQLGYTIDGVKAGKVGKNSVLKFQHSSDTPKLYNNQFKSPLGSKTKTGKQNKTPKPLKIDEPTSTSKKAKHRKKGSKKKISKEALDEFIDNMGPVGPFVDNFKFKKNPEESVQQFMRRVNEETNNVITKAKIDDKFDVSDEKKILHKIKTVKGMSEKKKNRLKEKKQKKLEAVKAKKNENKMGFAGLQDKVEFGEVVHAPPVLSVRPKKAETADIDRPGLRMPELKAAFAGDLEEFERQTKAAMSKFDRKVGQTVRRKSMTPIQKMVSDAQRDSVIESYRQMKKKKL